MIAVSRLDDSKGLTARFQAYSTGSRPTQRRASEPSPFKSHRRSEGAASLHASKDGEITLYRLVQLIERR